MVKGTAGLSCCFSVSLALGPQVSPMTASAVLGLLKLYVVFLPMETTVSLETTRAVMLSVWKKEMTKGSNVLAKLSKVDFKPWLAGYVSLSQKPGPRRMKGLAHNFYC